ncbi:unnamed protein product [Paramecium primaurelia]|uniref:Mei2-like C-terminal RNA recognition motif domain-containing protein n=1 Tax=Paramecium primaurelia TaxID=5886 RepID=A0A8S1K3M7_PARPR|nr:unnamed protein product [Paramecium primaurelia]
MLQANLNFQELTLEKDDDQLFQDLNQVNSQNLEDDIEQSDDTDDDFLDCFRYSVIISPFRQQMKPQTLQPQFNQDYQINPLCIKDDLRTTLMLKNIPLEYSLKDLIIEINAFVKGKYNYLYMPYDQIVNFIILIKKNCNIGYAFINLITTNDVEYFYKKFDQKKWQLNPDKICTLRYAKKQLNNY